ncbi:hypothetical protein GCM10008018_73040 [Paenibacillus marchantiophytorum]|uniref:Uncharacterized protein n=1 Tax=Paenibacillus marchantiophytorum TaxID=1619310 RepID=A0ABQ1FL85_9BACL|nr:hypothetical protein GCM10008018_73040 [Paenibacillus marchantiophytorum]
MLDVSKQGSNERSNFWITFANLENLFFRAFQLAHVPNME